MNRLILLLARARGLDLRSPERGGFAQVLFGDTSQGIILVHQIPDLFHLIVVTPMSADHFLQVLIQPDPRMCRQHHLSQFIHVWNRLTTEQGGVLSLFSLSHDPEPWQGRVRETLPGRLLQEFDPSGRALPFGVPLVPGILLACFQGVQSVLMIRVQDRRGGGHRGPVQIQVSPQVRDLSVPLS